MKYIYDIEIVRGESYDNDVTFESGVSLAGKTAQAQVRKKPGSAVLSAQFGAEVDTDENAVHLSLTNEQTAGMEPGEYEYDMFIVGDGSRKCYLGGKFIVRQNVTEVSEAETTSVTVTIIWVDDDDSGGDRPDSVTVILYQDGEQLQTATVTGNGNTWTHVFAGLPTGHTYTVDEAEVTGYVTDVDGYTITNELEE